MQTIYVRRIGDVPAKKALDVKIGDKLIFDDCQSAIVKEIQYEDKVVDMLVEDPVNSQKYHLRRLKERLVGFIPKAD